MKLENLQTDFQGTSWKREIDVRDFIQHNYEPYDGDESFLEGPSEKTKKLWDKLTEMFKVEREKGVYDAETVIPQSIDAYGAGYIDKDNEVIVGLQTDAPLKRGITTKVSSLHTTMISRLLVTLTSSQVCPMPTVVVVSSETTVVSPSMVQPT